MALPKEERARILANVKERIGMGKSSKEIRKYLVRYRKVTKAYAGDLVKTARRELGIYNKKTPKIAIRRRVPKHSHIDSNGNRVWRKAVI